MALSLDERIHRLPTELQSLIHYHFCADLDDSNFCFRIFKQPDNVLCSGCLRKKVKPREYGLGELICRFARRYQEYRENLERRADANHRVCWTLHEDEALFKYFRSISIKEPYVRRGVNLHNNENLGLWIYLMTGQQKDRKKVSSHLQVVKDLCRPGIGCSHQCSSYQCRPCVVSQLHDRVHKMAEWVRPDTSQYTLGPGDVTRLNEDLERLVAEFTHVIDHLTPASGNTGQESKLADVLTMKTVQQIRDCTSKLMEANAQVTEQLTKKTIQQIRDYTSVLIEANAQVTDQLTKKTVQRIRDCTSQLIEAVAPVSIRPSAKSRYDDGDDGDDGDDDDDDDCEWKPDRIRIALTDRLIRLQEVAETRAIENPSQKFDNTNYELSPPAVCKTARTLSPGLNQMLRVGADPKNRIIIQSSITTRTRAKNGEDQKDCNDRDKTSMKQQGPWISAKMDDRLSPYLWLEFDNFEALKVFTERTTKQTQMSITRIELEYDPFDEDLTADALVRTLNTKFPALRTFCTSVLPARQFAESARSFDINNSDSRPAPQLYAEREIAYFKALEKVTAHVYLLFRWKSDADWFAREYAEEGKWRTPVYKEQDQGFGEWIFDRGF